MHFTPVFHIPMTTKHVMILVPQSWKTLSQKKLMSRTREADTVGLELLYGK